MNRNEGERISEVYGETEDTEKKKIKKIGTAKIGRRSLTFGKSRM